MYRAGQPYAPLAPCASGRPMVVGVVVGAVQRIGCSLVSYPEVKVAAYFDGQRVVRTAADAYALFRSGALPRDCASRSALSAPRSPSISGQQWGMMPFDVLRE